MNLPYPDCTIRVSDCEDLGVVNTLDGFGLQTRLSIPFNGSIDVNTATSDTVFLISLGTRSPTGDPPGTVIGINQIVWDTFTDTLHVETDELLTLTHALRAHRHQSTARYQRKACRGDRELSPASADGQRSVQAGAARGYSAAARRLGVQERDIVAASVFTTRSITSVMERIRDQIKDGTPDPADFLLGRRVNARFSIWRTWRARLEPADPSEPRWLHRNPHHLAVLRYIAGGYGDDRLWVFVSPDYTFIRANTSRGRNAHRDPVVQGFNNIYFTLFLPSGPGRKKAGRSP